MSPQSGESTAAPGSFPAPGVPSGAPEALDPFQQLLRRYNHDCRNSLSAIKLGLYLFERESTLAMAPRWNELSLVYGDIERLFDRLQMIYRKCSLTWVRCPLGQLIAERTPLWQRWFDARGRSLQVDFPPRDDPGDFDPMYLGSGLDAFLAWRATAAEQNREPRLSWRIEAEWFEVSWDETGQKSECCSVEGDHPTAQPSADPECTDSLALILLGRIVSAHGGKLETKSAPAFNAKLRWPQICPRKCSS